jgi:hypothetical protein
MHAFATAFSFALLLTAMFAFRYEIGRTPSVAAAYFALFMGLEWIVERHFIPPGAFGFEVALLCGLLSVPFLVATYLTRHHVGSRDISDS